MIPASTTDWQQVDRLSDEEIAQGIAADPDAAPEWTEADFQRARPAADVVPDIVKAYRKTRDSQKAPKKVSVSIRLSPEVVDYFKLRGRGWQTRINEALVEYVTKQE